MIFTIVSFAAVISAALLASRSFTVSVGFGVDAALDEHSTFYAALARGLGGRPTRRPLYPPAQSETTEADRLEPVDPEI